ncbi:unnamed protein product [Ectocarpus fasciculatus]
MQFWLFCAMHSTTFILLAAMKPFSNSVLNTMGAIVMLIDAVCMGMLALAASTWDGTAAATRLDMAVLVIQQVAIAALVIPLYVDMTLMLFGFVGMIRIRRARVAASETEAERAERHVIKRLTLRLWGCAWFRMVRSNLFACLRDTREGVRGPTSSRQEGRLKTGRIGPFPEGDCEHLS